MLLFLRDVFESVFVIHNRHIFFSVRQETCIFQSQFESNWRRLNEESVLKPQVSPNWVRSRFKVFVNGPHSLKLELLNTTLIKIMVPALKVVTLFSVETNAKLAEELRELSMVASEDEPTTAILDEKSVDSK